MLQVQRKWIVCLLTIFLLTQSSLLLAAPVVQETPGTYQWQMTEIFSSEEAFNQACQSAAAQIKALGQYQGKLGQKNDLLAYNQKNAQLQSLLLDIQTYGDLLNALDVQNEKGIIYTSQAGQLFTSYWNTTAFAIPEMRNLPEATIKAYLADSDLAGISSIFAADEHALSPEEEALLTEVSGYTDFSSTYNLVTISELDYGTMTDEKGKLIKVTPAIYQKLLFSEKVADQIKAMDLYYAALAARSNTLADLYNKHVGLVVTEARLRGYSTSLEEALGQYEVTSAVYNQIKKSVNQNLSLGQDLINAAAKEGGSSEVPPTQPQKKYTMAEAKQEILASLAPLGPEFVATAKGAFEENWIDAYPSPNKMTGAMTLNANNHPYILLNFTGTLEDVTSMAHELGHGMHNYYTNQTQPPGYQGSTLLSAETASQTTELLYLKYKLGQVKSDSERGYILDKMADEFQGAVYTQMRYAEFEEASHAYVEKGGTLTADYLNSIWYDGLKKYNAGTGATISQNLSVGWASVPHFYTDFYVLNYALSYMAANVIADGILAGEMGPEFITFLKAGTSQPSLDLIKNMGIDLGKPAAYNKAFEDYLSLYTQMGKTAPSKAA